MIYLYHKNLHEDFNLTFPFTGIRCHIWRYQFVQSNQQLVCFNDKPVYSGISGPFKYVSVASVCSFIMQESENNINEQCFYTSMTLFVPLSLCHYISMFYPKSCPLKHCFFIKLYLCYNRGWLSPTT